MSAVEYILTEGGEPLMVEDNVGGGNCLIVEPFTFSLVNNYAFVTVGNGMSCTEGFR